MINEHQIFIIAAVDEEFGIGKNNDLAWNYPSDMQHFQTTTTNVETPGLQNAVIMGRNTWESLPKKFQPLPDRYNIVLTSDLNFQPTGADVAPSLEEAFAMADLPDVERIFVIGGASVYAEAMKNERVDGIYLTHISGTHDCDVFFPPVDERFSEVETLKHAEENDHELEFSLYTKEEGEDEE